MELDDRNAFKPGDRVDEYETVNIHITGLRVLSADNTGGVFVKYDGKELFVDMRDPAVTITPHSAHGGDIRRLRARIADLEEDVADLQVSISDLMASISEFWEAVWQAEWEIAHEKLGEIRSADTSLGEVAGQRVTQ